jgi:hypothetical protein
MLDVHKNRVSRGNVLVFAYVSVKVVMALKPKGQSIKPKRASNRPKRASKRPTWQSYRSKRAE